MDGKPERLRAGLVTPLTLVLTLVAAIGFYFIAQRLIHGFDAVTHLSAGYPWGIWVVVDMVIGTALGCGGFAMAILVYVFNRGELHPLMRPALLGGLFGYTLAGVAVMIDLGRYWQFYNLMLPGYINLNSVLFETAACVMAYVMVLWLEFAPAILERLGLSHLRKALERVMWMIIALGIVLPMMHQSTLGTTLIPLGHKLSPLYQTPLLPLLFVVSALVIGYGVVVAEATVVSRGFRLPSEHRLLVQLGQVTGWVLALWLVVRWADIVWRGALGAAFDGSLVAGFFWAENLIALFAVFTTLSRVGQHSERLTFLGGTAVILFAALYRINGYLIAYTPAVGGYSYFPAASELMVTLGIIALEILLYLVFIKIFPVLHLPARRGRTAAARAQEA